MLRRQVAALLESSSPVLPFLDSDAIRERLATPAEVRAGMAARMRFEQVLAFDAWLRDYRVTVDV